MKTQMMTLETSGLRLNPVITIRPQATRQHIWSEVLVQVSPRQLTRIRKACGGVLQPLTWLNPKGGRAAVRLVDSLES